MNYTCYAFDLDFTLTHFTRGIAAMIDAVCDLIDEPREEIEALMDEVVDSAAGFSHKTFVARIAERYSNVPTDEIERAICDWLDGDLARYADTDAALARHAPIAIITAGNEVWQMKKISAARIEANHLFIVSPTTGKAAAIQELIDRVGAPIIYVDDRPEELDRIRDVHSPDTVITYHIVRDDSPYRDKTSRHAHQKINTLAELI